MYLLGAAIADPARCDGVRDDLRAILPKGAPKLHWHQMGAKEKDRATGVVASVDALHVVVVGTPLDPKKQERARAYCLERLCWRLGELGVTQAFLEQRPESLNHRDRKLIDSLRGKGSIPKGLRIEIQQPSTEPMLWIPDQLLGALGDHHSSHGHNRWFDRYAHVEQIRITL